MAAMSGHAAGCRGGQTQVSIDMAAPMHATARVSSARG
jgi:hypothetical protein